MQQVADCLPRTPGSQAAYSFTHCKWCAVAHEFADGDTMADEHLLRLLIASARYSPRLQFAHEHARVEVAHDALLRILGARKRYDYSRCFRSWATKILKTELCHVGRNAQSERARRQCDTYRASLMRSLAVVGPTQHLSRLAHLRAKYGSWESLYRNSGVLDATDAPLDRALWLIREDTALSCEIRQLAHRLAEEVSTLRVNSLGCVELPEVATALDMNEVVEMRDEVIGLLIAGLDALPDPLKLLASELLGANATEQQEEGLRAFADYLDEHPETARAIRNSIL
jgi:DNA-directed RNA polymerase specialized sigma24 family protein